MEEATCHRWQPPVDSSTDRCEWHMSRERGGVDIQLDQLPHQEYNNVGTVNSHVSVAGLSRSQPFVFGSNPARTSASSFCLQADLRVPLLSCRVCVWLAVQLEATGH